MLKYMTILFAMLCCDAQKNRVPGKYDNIILVQNPPLLAYFNGYREWPTKNTSLPYGGLDVDDCALLFREKQWIAHGLWPSKIRRSPTFCRQGQNIPHIMKYNAGQMNRIFKKKLKTTFPDLFANRTTKSIWHTEWNKHGTCLTDQESMNTVKKYFSKTVELLNQYNIGNILAQYSILPGNNYTINQIISVLTTYLGKRIMLSCLPVENSAIQEQYIFEVHICFNKTIHLTDCNSNDTFHCNTNQTAIYAKWKED